MQDFDIVILEDECGGHVASVPALPGCHTQGDTLQEVLDNTGEAIDLYLETLSEDERRSNSNMWHRPRIRTQNVLRGKGMAPHL
jgi:predicted RNase H-like HicB family nuclease